MTRIIRITVGNSVAAISTKCQGVALMPEEIHGDIAGPDVHGERMLKAKLDISMVQEAEKVKKKKNETKFSKEIDGAKGRIRMSMTRLH